MKASIKLIICYLLTVVSIFLIINFWGVNRYEKQIRSQYEDNYVEIAEKLSDMTTEWLYDQDRNIQVVRSELVNTSELIGARIWLVNAKMMMVVDTGMKNGLPFSDLNNFDLSLFEHTVSTDIIAEDFYYEPVMFICVPMMVKYQVNGYVCILIPNSEMHNEAVHSMDAFNLCLCLVAAILLVVFIIIYIFTVAPTRKIRDAAVAYSKGNFDTKIKINTHDEFRELADSIDFMVGRLGDTEERQRKFIANISHDFRSPLTSIKGYAEAIKDGTIPYENKDKYLDIILYEADRLHKLTSNILELNTIDNGSMALDIKSFDINSVIRVIADSFEGICRKKKIGIKLLFDDSEMFVDGDVGRIEQVIHNLLDNAIKFSGADTEILVEVTTKGSKALVRVKDEGCGISKESIHKIWDRFYKGDESRGKDKKGTGLGLSIVKEIIQAHGENINVISTLGAGTEFTFTLALS